MEGTPGSSSLDDVVDLKDAGASAPAVAVLGTGLYGRALAARLRAAGAFDVRVGSRAAGAGRTTPAVAVHGADVVLLAVPAHAHAAVLGAVGPHLAPGAVLVDVSNHALSAPPARAGAGSLAARVRALAPPHVAVAKAFSTLSAYHIAPGGVCKALPVVHIACDDAGAVRTLSHVCARMGLLPVHHGGLAAAAELERSAHTLFPTWTLPGLVAGGVFVWWVLYCFLGGWVLRTRDRRNPGQLRGIKWDVLPLRLFMFSTAQAAMTLFALTFVPGPVASLVQLARGSASRPFGRKFGAWLAMRKELGVIAFFFASMHMCAGVLSRSHIEDGWKGQFYFVLGIVSYALFALLAISSSRSVSDNMSWAEFRAVFSWVGVAALVFGVLHQGFWGWIIHKHRPTSYAWPGLGVWMPHVWLGIILPCFALALRAITWSPCVVAPLRKLRNEIAVDTKALESTFD